MKTKGMLCVFLCFAIIQVWAQENGEPTGEQRKLLSLENMWNQAFKQKDQAALQMLMGADLIYVDYDGKLMNKTEYLASATSVVTQPSRVVNESMNVTMYGGVAIVNGIYRESGSKSGKPYLLRERFTDTWVRRNENWVCVASQSTLISP
jgi:ketosteroid isomerase-like protein